MAVALDAQCPLETDVAEEAILRVDDAAGSDDLVGATHLRALHPAVRDNSPDHCGSSIVVLDDGELRRQLVGVAVEVVQRLDGGGGPGGVRSNISPTNWPPPTSPLTTPAMLNLTGLPSPWVVTHFVKMTWAFPPSRLLSAAVACMASAVEVVTRPANHPHGRLGVGPADAFG